MPRKDQIATALLIFSAPGFLVAALLLSDGMTIVDASGYTYGAIARLGLGASVLLLAFRLLVSSLGMFVARTNDGADRWLRWLGKWRPRLR